MNLPTPEEFAAALDGYTHEAPQPVQAAIERCAVMTGLFQGLIDGFDPHPEMEKRLKVLLVIGLNIGIRIGEARGSAWRAKNDGLLEMQDKAIEALSRSCERCGCSINGATHNPISGECYRKPFE